MTEQELLFELIVDDIETLEEKEPDYEFYKVLCRRGKEN